MASTAWTIIKIQNMAQQQATFTANTSMIMNNIAFYCTRQNFIKNTDPF